jgi:YVTN family beta-propeller protein
MQSVNVGGPARSIVASPDGKRVYVAVAGAVGIRVLDAANLFTYHTAPLTINDGGRDNPQGMAISPDGRTLIVSDGKVGGIVTVYAIVGDTLVAGLPFTLPATQAPLGVAFSPDGTRAYVAGADGTPGTAGSLHVFNPANGNPIGSGVTVGIMPTAIAVSPNAVSPNGTQVFVTNKDSDTVSVYDGANIVSNIPVGNEPTGIAFSPSGEQVFVTNYADNSISIINATSLGISNLTGLQAPLAIAVNSRGTTAYIAQLNSAGAREIGGLRVVTVVLGGTGIGNVRSSDSRISCGTACQAEFPLGAVTLTASAGGNSSFAGWGNGCSGFSSSTTFNVNANTTCLATFNANAPPPSQQNQQQQGCFIATAAYGSDMAREVKALREFRDRRLMASEPGRALVRFYYRNSPPLADLIRDRDGARAAVRAALMPVVWSIEHPTAALWLAGFCVLLVMGWRVRARTNRSSRGAA